MKFEEMADKILKNKEAADKLLKNKDSGEGPKKIDTEKI